MHAYDPTLVHSARGEIFLSRSLVVNAKEAALGHWLLALGLRPLLVSALSIARSRAVPPCGPSTNSRGLEPSAILKSGGEAGSRAESPHQEQRTL